MPFTSHSSQRAKSLPNMSTRAPTRLYWQDIAVAYGHTSVAALVSRSQSQLPQFTITTQPQCGTNTCIYREVWSHRTHIYQRPRSSLVCTFSRGPHSAQVARQIVVCGESFRGAAQKRGLAGSHSALRSDVARPGVRVDARTTLQACPAHPDLWQTIRLLYGRRRLHRRRPGTKRRESHNSRGSPLREPAGHLITYRRCSSELIGKRRPPLPPRTLFLFVCSQHRGWTTPRAGPSVEPLTSRWHQPAPLRGDSSGSAPPCLTDDPIRTPSAFHRHRACLSTGSAGTGTALGRPLAAMVASPFVSRCTRQGR